MKLSWKWPLVALCLGIPLTAEAHRSWMLPSATVLSGDDVWITVDAAVSNDLFYFEHFPLRIANLGGPAHEFPNRRGGGRGAELTVFAPDGAKVPHHNGATGRYRATFDVHIQQRGTYKLVVANQSASASYKEGGQTKRWFGAPEEFAKAVPADAQELRASFNQSRMEVFVTSGKPTTGTLKVTGQGLELAPVTHPNDLVAGSPATFRFVLDGKPAPNVKVSIVPGGNRYRDKLGDMTVTTDADGKFSVTWPTPGMYWMEAVVRDDNSPVQGIKNRRAGYVATLEVLPP